MRVILDECLPRKLRRELAGHIVTTVPQAGFAGLTNGRLLRRLEGSYDAFITIDGSFVSQQPVSHPQRWVLERVLLHVKRLPLPGQVIELSLRHSLPDLPFRNARPRVHTTPMYRAAGCLSPAGLPDAVE